MACGGFVPNCRPTADSAGQFLNAYRSLISPTWPLLAVHQSESDNCVHVAPFTPSLQSIPCGSPFHALSSARQPGFSSPAACPSRPISVFNPLYIGSGLVQTLLSGMLGRSIFAHASAFFRPSTPDRNLWFFSARALPIETCGFSGVIRSDQDIRLTQQEFLRDHRGTRKRRALSVNVDESKLQKG